MRLPRRLVTWAPIEVLDRADPVLGAIPPRAHALHWNEDGFEPPPGAVEVLKRPRGGRAEGFRLGRLAWGVQFHPEVDDAALEGWYAEWGDVLAPAGVTEAGARSADARHLPGQAALSAAIFGAFARLVRSAAGRPLSPRLIGHPRHLQTNRAEQHEHDDAPATAGTRPVPDTNGSSQAIAIANGAHHFADAGAPGGDHQDDRGRRTSARSPRGPSRRPAQPAWVASEIATDCSRGSASASARS